MSLATMPTPENDRFLIRTRAVQKSEQLLKHVVEDRTIGMAIAEFGGQKTYPLKQWRRKNEGKVRHIWIEMTVTLSPGPILNALIDALRVECNHGNMWLKMQAIAASLAKDPVLVIIDEADLLNVRGFEVLRSIWDRVSDIAETDGESAFPLAFFGGPRLRTMLQREDLGRLHRRIAEIVALDPLNEAELQAALQRKWPELRCDDGGFRALLELSRGSFGWLNEIVRIVKKMKAVREGGPVTAQVVSGSRKYLLGLPEDTA